MDGINNNHNKKSYILRQASRQENTTAVLASNVTIKASHPKAVTTAWGLVHVFYVRQNLNVSVLPYTF